MSISNSYVTVDENFDYDNFFKYKNLLNPWLDVTNNAMLAPYSSLSVCHYFQSDIGSASG